MAEAAELIEKLVEALKDCRSYVAEFEEHPREALAKTDATLELARKA